MVVGGNNVCVCRRTYLVRHFVPVPAFSGQPAAVLFAQKDAWLAVTQPGPHQHNPYRPFCCLLSILSILTHSHSCDGGRVCRPLIICDDGVPRVATSHINRLKAGEWGFSDFLKRGEWVGVTGFDLCRFV